jgi:predicted O-linked N-acetylglucosamine transferase (SPINDLY family)
MQSGLHNLCACGSGKLAAACCGARTAFSRPPQWQQSAPAGDPRETQRAALANELQQGFAAHRAGRLTEAAQRYQRIIAADPRHADALHLLGVIAYQSGQFAPAVELTRRAIAVNPNVPDFHANLGHALRDTGDLAAAEASYRQALRGRPAYPEVLNNLGLILQTRGQLVEAATVFEQALAASPDFVPVLMNLGGVRHGQGDLEAAEALYRRALALQPDFAQALNNLGSVQQARGNIAEAQRLYEEALTLQPDYGDALCNLGALLYTKGDTAGAEQAYRKAIGAGAAPDNARVDLGAMLRRQGDAARAVTQFEAVLARDPLHQRAHMNLGVARQDEGRLGEALAHYLVAKALGLPAAELDTNIASALGSLGRLDLALSMLRLRASGGPASVEIHVNIGSNLFSQGKLAEAAAELRQAIAIEPRHINANWNLAMVELAQGHLSEAWDAYEWRLAREKALFGKPVRPFTHPRWDGNALRAGSTLLVFPEQGVGDEIWAAGMVAELLAGPAREARVVIECRMKLVPLFQRSFPRAEVVAWTQTPSPSCEEGVDYQIAGGSLGKMFRRDLASFPRRETSGGAYLFADPSRERHWKQRLAAIGTGLKVGICWRSSDIRGQRALSCTQLLQWTEVFKVPGVHFVSLQYDEGEAELAAAEQAFGVCIQRYPEVDMYDDLDETAALMRGLDLVISAPTSVSILSAALGVPTWQMNYGVEWQRHGCADNPWYPAMKNYARRWDQPWEGVLAEIAGDLSSLAGQGAPRPARNVISADGATQFANALRVLREGDRDAAGAILRNLDSNNAAGIAARALAAALDGQGANSLEHRLLRACAEAAVTPFEFAFDAGNALRLAGRRQDARPLLDAAVALDGNSAAAWYALGALAGAEDNAAAMNALEHAHRCDPTAEYISAALAGAIDRAALEDIAADRNADACAKLQRAAHLKPDSPEILFHLGSALQATEQFDAATAAYRQVVGLRPDFVAAWNNLANTLRAGRQLDESIACFRRALDIEPRLAGIHSNLLLTMNYAEGIDAKVFFAEHVDYGRRAAAGVAVPASPVRGAPQAERKLRVGYVSGDFKAHPVMRFLEPILAHHDRTKFEIHCYATSSRSDALTTQVRSRVDGWKSLVGLDDEAAAQSIREDEIDILVDLAGHTALNRLPVFARKPAPVQVSYLGYPATTGLAAMDYKIVDNLTAPDNLAGLFTETLWRMAGPMWAFAPDSRNPEVAPLPAKRNGFVTFGSFNSVIKLGTKAICVWANILREVPGSRLILATVPEGETRAQLDREFAGHGVDGTRLTYHARLESAAFWSLYADTDIALDTFPCNGGTTTFETLWMGVPLVALAGGSDDTLVSHVSSAILRGLGLEELVAKNGDDYARLAVALARDLPRLERMRADLRRRLAESAYLDHAGFTANLELAYRAMWKKYGATQMAAVQ